MRVIEKISTSEKKKEKKPYKKKPYKNSKGKKLKSQRANIDKYNTLLAKAEDLGVTCIEFDKDFSYKQKIKIVKEIIKREK